MDELKQLINDAINQAIQLHNYGPMNTQEAAEYLRISRRKLDDIVISVPHSMVGGRRIFTRKDLDDYIEKNKIPVKI